MPKDKVTVTLDPEVIADADADAADEGLNRSEFVERALRDAHYRRLLARAESGGFLTNPDGLRGLLDWQANPGESAA